jgi:EAL domain-containing protein (putative c-di-GMP-specific phosphodiesterase class I)
MKDQSGIYQYFKLWLTKKMQIEQPQVIDIAHEEQLIYIDPIFDTQNGGFAGASFNNLNQDKQESYLKQFKNALDTIAYWHCHGRSIISFLPLPITFLFDQEFLLEYEKHLTSSQLPVGLIRVPLIGVKSNELELIESQLLQLQRLGIILEIKNYSGCDSELIWLQSQLIKGVHISIGFVRAAMMASLSYEKFNNLMMYCQSQNHHTYVEGISLVHDFNFAKENKIQFCYGPLMMSSVSKHQLLKITTSQLNQSFKTFPKKNTKYGK